MVQDALAQMPLQTSEDFDREIGALVKAAPESVLLLADKLQPAAKGANSLVEYALSGIVSYVSAPENAAWLEAVRKGFDSAVESCGDEVNKVFLWSQYRLIVPAEPMASGFSPVLPEEALKKARLLGKSSNSSDRCRSLWLRAWANGKFGVKELLSALKDDDPAYRNTALEIASGYADAGYIAGVVKKYSSLSEEAGRDVINWLGSLKADSQTDFLVACAGGGAAVPEAIAALGMISGDKTVKCLVEQLGTDYSASAVKALKSVKYDLNGIVAEELRREVSCTGAILDGGCGTKRILSLMELAAHRRMKNASGDFFALAESPAAAVSGYAKENLWTVVTGADAKKVAALLDSSSAEDAAFYQKALVASLSSLPADRQYEETVCMMNGSSAPGRYYPVLAACGTDKAVKTLSDAFRSGDYAAVDALVAIDNYKAWPVLTEIAGNGISAAEPALLRAVALAGKYEADIDRRAYKYIQALELAGSSEAKNAVLQAMQDAPVMKTFLVAGKYLDDPATRYAAAQSARIIAAKCIDDIDYDSYRTVLEKARDIFAAKGGADDGYAVDEINLMLSEARPYGRTVLSEEEAALGFELLFDGTGLDKWTGDMDGYTPVNGTIFVTANYGNSRNLYTKDEYRDFIFRFEFCFDREGVNNGVGIRTPMGVDAAYDGMCEVQILDHDAPIYKDLHAYQVHGSAYGIVPAKRIVHKPLGEWNEEEIVVRGDRVKVTLNGEVILDSDLREACQGHNVAPDGGKVNPYTVDRKNHPGLFNEKGHVGFLGHGAGIRFRNVRILAL